MTSETPAQQLARQFREAVELRLITLIEDIEGHVPTDAEMGALGAKEIHSAPHREVWKWRGEVILTAYIASECGIVQIVLHSPPGVLR